MQVPTALGHMKQVSFVMEVIMMATTVGSSLIGTPKF